jgi:hypothetical protein
MQSFTNHWKKKINEIVFDLRGSKIQIDIQISHTSIINCILLQPGAAMLHLVSAKLPVGLHVFLYTLITPAHSLVPNFSPNLTAE